MCCPALHTLTDDNDLSFVFVRYNNPFQFFEHPLPPMLYLPNNKYATKKAYHRFLDSVNIFTSILFGKKQHYFDIHIKNRVKTTF